MKTTKQILYKMIHRNKKPIEQIAEELDISANSLYRYCLDGDSGSKMPFEKAVPLMKVTKNYELLEHAANLCGFVLVKEQFTT